ncbi:MAG: hypothetical protein GY796_05690, partial [Chloroflexi bacterium]|nr:hypothetical protein [Chloroflexota bacterium]
MSEVLLVGVFLIGVALLGTGAPILFIWVGQKLWRLPWWRHPVWTVLAFVGFLLLYIFPMRFFIISEGDWFGWLIVGFQA